MPLPPPPSQIDAIKEERYLAISYYNAARAEILQRLALREQVLLAYLAVVGVLAGLLAHSPAPKDSALLDPVGLVVLEIVPWLSLIFALATRRHNFVIRHLGTYIFDEIGPALSQTSDRNVAYPETLRHWDSSRTLHQILDSFLRREHFADGMILLIPSFGAIVFATFQIRWWPCPWNWFNSGALIGWFGWIVTLVFLGMEFFEKSAWARP